MNHTISGTDMESVQADAQPGASTHPAATEVSQDANIHIALPIKLQKDDFEKYVVSRRDIILLWLPD